MKCALITLFFHEIWQRIIFKSVYYYFEKKSGETLQKKFLDLNVQNCLFLNRKKICFTLRGKGYFFHMYNSKI